MAMVTGAKRRRRLEEEEEDEEQIRRLREEEEDEEQLEDRISALPDGVLGDIVSLLPTKDGARTQVLSARWRHIWRSAPLNIDLDPNPYAPLSAKSVPAGVISGILSAHQGPGRRFSVPDRYTDYMNLQDSALDSWLGSPALDGLEELGFHYGRRRPRNMGPLPLQPLPPPLPASVHRFSSTLRVASFGGCSFPDENSTSGLQIQLPLLRQLSLSNVRISESSLLALLAACPALQSLLLSGSIGCSSIRIVSPTLRSIGVNRSYGNIMLQQLIIEDAPCLDMLHCFDCCGKFTISVISAPQLRILGTIFPVNLRLELGATVFQERHFVSLKTVTHSVKILALTQEHLSLDVVIEFMNCFPCMEKLYITTNMAGEKNLWCHKYRNLIGTVDIRLKKIVLAGYRGNKSHVNFAKFFVLNARTLESMRLGLVTANPSDAWIEKQHSLLQIKKKASRDMQLDFVDNHCLPMRYSLLCSQLCTEKTHDLSTADPFSWHA